MCGSSYLMAALAPYQWAILCGAMAGVLLINLPLQRRVPAAPDAAAAPQAATDAAPADADAAASAPTAGAQPSPPAPGRFTWSPEDSRSSKVAVRYAIDAVVLSCIALAIVTVAWRELKWGTLSDVLDRLAGIFPAEVAFVRRLAA